VYNFTPPCLDTTLSLPDLGLTAIGQHHTGRHLTVLCLITDNDRSCPVCGQRGLVRATRIRKLVHPPIGLTAVTLAIRIRTYTCPSCHQRWSQTPQRACAGRSKLSTTARLWALKSVVIDKMSIHVIAKNLATSWNTVCTAVLDLGRSLLYSVRKHRIGTIAEVHYRDSVAKSRADNPLSKPSKADSGLVGHTYFLPSPAQSVLRAVTFRRKRSTVIGDNSCHCPDSRTSMPRSAYEWFQTRFRFAIATGNE
jgi:predicted RNA-binding Zn-ribbon protein involved in translation (DUF1610 family)